MRDAQASGILASPAGGELPPLPSPRTSGDGSERPLPPLPLQAPYTAPAPLRSQPPYSAEDEQLRLVLELSMKETSADDIRRKQEEEELERILQLSLTEK